MANRECDLGKYIIFTKGKIRNEFLKRGIKKDRKLQFVCKNVEDITEEDVSLVVSEDQEDDVDEPGEKQTSDSEEPGADKQTSDSEEPCAVGDKEGDSASDSEEYGAAASYFHFSDEETPRPSSSRVNIFQMKNFARKVRTPGTQDGGA